MRGPTASARDGGARPARGRGDKAVHRAAKPSADGDGGSRPHLHGAWLRDKPDLMFRMGRIVGQARGIQRMIQGDRYCPEILTQITAVRAALDRVGLILLENHTRGCIVGTVQEGHSDEAVAELMAILGKFLP